ncbi:MAG: hypothetical protein ACOY5Y_17110 [Pseudomonadota bacterium]
MTNETVRQAVNLAILTAHRLGEPRVLELSHEELAQLRLSARPSDWTGGAYRGLRVEATKGSQGRILAWDRARETEVAQRINWATP